MCDDGKVIDAINQVIAKNSHHGFWETFKILRRIGYAWNHKRVYRVYCVLKLNKKSRAKKRILQRARQPLFLPDKANQVWSADFMSDSLYAGKRFRTFNVIDDCNRVVLAIEIDPSITAKRLIRVFERLQIERSLPHVLRVENRPEFLSGAFVSWAEQAGMMVSYIQPGEPNQNAYVERFNGTYRNKVLDLYLISNLEEVREITYWWMIEYNEKRPHDSLEDLASIEYMMVKKENSTFQVSS